MAIRNFDLAWFNKTMQELEGKKIVLPKTQYRKPKADIDGLLTNGGTKGDMYTKMIMDLILQEGTIDENPRPKYKDEYIGAKYIQDKRMIITKDNEEIYLSENDIIEEQEDRIIVWVPAHTLSVNNGVECTYDLSKGETPLITLRHIATNASFQELLWIYQQTSNDLVLFDKLIGKDTWEDNHQINNWWKDWALKDEKGNYVLNEQGHPTIGSCYGETVRRRDLVNQLLNGLKNNKFGRRQIIDMWQIDDFNEPHGLKPCAYNTTWNIRRERDGEYYLDMTLSQRSSDFATAGCINQFQYVAFQTMIANELGIKPGRFTWKPVNVQLYDRHIEQAIEMLDREPINCSPKIILPEGKKFHDLQPNDYKLEGYPKELIKQKNPPLKFQLGI